MTEERYRALIQWLPEKANADQGGANSKTYYLLNITHPVIAKLLKRYRNAHGISERYPMSDAERTEFELSFFKVKVLEELEAYCLEPDTSDDTVGSSPANTAKEKTHCPPIQR